MNSVWILSSIPLLLLNWNYPSKNCRTCRDLSLSRERFFVLEEVSLFVPLVITMITPPYRVTFLSKKKIFFAPWSRQLVEHILALLTSPPAHRTSRSFKARVTGELQAEPGTLRLELGRA